MTDEAFMRTPDGKLPFFVQWIDQEGNNVDSEVVLTHSITQAVMRIGRRMAEQREPLAAFGFYIRQQRITDIPTLTGTLQQRKGQSK
jgi:hypothetical protein